MSAIVESVINGDFIDSIGMADNRERTNEYTSNLDAYTVFFFMVCARVWNINELLVWTHWMISYQ